MSIKKLNDDCLVCIFQCLSLNDILKVELVCKQWRKVSTLVRSNLKGFDLRFFLPDEDSAVEDKKVAKTTFLVNIFKSRGLYIDKLYIDSFGLKNIYSSYFLKNFPKFCCNLTYLEICDNISSDKIFTNKDLRLLFTKSFNLSKVSLNYLNVQGDCLNKLSEGKIRELSIANCEFDFEGILSNLENLNKINLFDENVDNIIKLLDALSLCQNITEIFIRSYDPLSTNVPRLPIFLSNQKNLRKLKLKNVFINSQLLNGIPIENFREFFLSTEDNRDLSNLKNSLNRFDNLEHFLFDVNELNLDNLEDIIKYLNVNVKKIEIIFKNFVIKDSNLDFSKFVNLETFIIENADFINASYESIDIILKNLLKCKKLKNLVINSCNFSNVGLYYISLFPNLESLKICWCGLDIDEESFGNIFKTALNLKKLRLENCSKVSNSFVNFAYKIKSDRGDKNRLEIFFRDCNCVDFGFKDWIPLIFITVINRKVMVNDYQENS